MAERKLRKDRLGVFLMLMLIFGVGFWCFIDVQQKVSVEKDLIISALNSGMIQYRNKLGQQVTERKALVISYNDFKRANVSKDSEIGQLKAVINKNTHAATIFTTSTTRTVTGVAPVVIRSPIDSCNPIYKKTISDQWSAHDVIASKYSVTVACTSVNTYTFTDETQKETWSDAHKAGRWLFRQRFLNTKLINGNPHTTTTGLASFRRPLPDKKKQNAMIGAGLVVTGFLIRGVIQKAILFK